MYGTWYLRCAPLKRRPRPLIVVLPIALGERSLILDRALDGTARLGVVLDVLLDGARLHVFHLLPPLALEADTRETAVLVVDDAAVLVVLADDRELYGLNC